MSDTDSAPAFERMSANNHAAWVVVTSYVLIIFSILAVAAKIISRIHISKFPMYDGLIVIATSIALAQSICLTLACKYGLGRHRNTLDEASFELYSKFFYSAQILLIAALAFTKASVANFIIVLHPQTYILMLCRCLLVVVALWATSGIFAFALQCRLPKPWLSAPGACINQRALYNAIGITNIITDLTLVILPVFMMWKVQTAVKIKCQIVGLFGIRIIVPIFTILNITAMEPLFSATPPDPTWHAATPSIWSQIMLNLAILTACMPSLKRLLDTFRSGTAAVTITGPYELSSSGGLASSETKAKFKAGIMSSVLSSRNKSVVSGRHRTKSGGEKLQDLDISASKFSGYGHGDNLNNSNKSRIGHTSRAEGRNSIEQSDSVKGLTDNVIVHTMDYKVEFDRQSQGEATLREQDGRSGHSKSTRDGEGEGEGNGAPVHIPVR